MSEKSCSTAIHWLLNVILFVICVTFSVSSVGADKCSVIFNEFSEISGDSFDKNNIKSAQTLKQLDEANAHSRDLWMSKQNTAEEHLKNSIYYYKTKAKMLEKTNPQASKENLEMAKIMEVELQNVIKAQKNFVAYLGNLLDQNILQLDHILMLKESLEKGELINPVPHEKNSHGAYFIKSSYQIHYEALQKMIGEGRLDPRELLKLVNKIIEDKGRSKERRNKAEQDTHYMYQKMEFHRVEPGDFVMGIIQGTVEVKISKPFEMMSTPVTQMMWAQIQVALGEVDVEKINPSHYKTGENGRIHKIKNFEVQMQADNPVETITWDKAKEFIDGLNNLSKEDDPKIQNFLENIIVGHQKGDEYDFPTEAQWEFVLRDRGRGNKLFIDTDDMTELHRYAWFMPHSNGVSQPVAMLEPRIVDGKAFYDLQGNVGEWIKDGHLPRLTGGVDPEPLYTGGSHVFRGGSSGSLSHSMRAGDRFSLAPHLKAKGIGIRLVRKVKVE